MLLYFGINPFIALFLGFFLIQSVAYPLALLYCFDFKTLQTLLYHFVISNSCVSGENSIIFSSLDFNILLLIQSIPYPLVISYCYIFKTIQPCESLCYFVFICFWNNYIMAMSLGTSLWLCLQDNSIIAKSLGYFLFMFVFSRQLVTLCHYVLLCFGDNSKIALYLRFFVFRYF